MIIFQASFLDIYIYVTGDAACLMDKILLPVADSRWDFSTVTKDSTLNKNNFCIC